MKSALFVLMISCSLRLIAFEGFYVGGALGGHLTEGVQAGNIQGISPSGFIDEYFYSIDLDSNLFSRGVAGMLYAGYGIRWRSLYLAAEGFVQYGPAKLKSEQSGDNVLGNATNAVILAFISSSTQAHARCYQSGVDFLPGWAPHPATLLYGRIGISAATVALKIDSVNFGRIDLGFGDIDNWDLPLSFF